MYANYRVPSLFAWVILFGFFEMIANYFVQNTVSTFVHYDLFLQLSLLNFLNCNHIVKDHSCFLLVLLQAYSDSIPSYLLVPTIQSLRGSDHLHSQFHVTQSMPSRYSNAQPSISSSTVSLSEVS